MRGMRSRAVLSSGGECGIMQQQASSRILSAVDVDSAAMMLLEGFLPTQKSNTDV
jgi:hypothetical protein